MDGDWLARIIISCVSAGTFVHLVTVKSQLDVYLLMLYVNVFKTLRLSCSCML